MRAARPILTHTALRGIAALLVVGYHLQFGVGYRLDLERLTPFFRRGYLWVDLFFVLSGFIISYVNQADRPVPMPAQERRRFWLGRFSRIYPLHIVCLATYVGVAAGISLLYIKTGRRPPFDWDHKSLLTIGAQVILINAWLSNVGGWNIPSWSISAEIVAYGLFPFLMDFHARWRRLSEVVMIVMSASFMTWVAATTGSLDIVGAGLAPGRCMAGFLLGMAAYFNRDFITRLSPAMLTFLQMVAVIGILAILFVKRNDTIIVPFFVLLVWTTWTDAGVAPKLLSHPSMLWLGNISYSIYMVHVPVIAILALGWAHLSELLGLDRTMDRLAWLATVSITVLVVAHMTFRYVERPIRQWLAVRWLHHRVDPIGASPAAP